MTLRIALAVALLLPASAQAHLVSTRFGAFYSGMIHPLSAIEHLVPWLGISLLAALQSTGTARSALLAFPLAVGTGAGLAALPGAVSLSPTATLIVTGSFVVLGLMAALGLRLSTTTLLVLALLTGLGHGHANATAIAPGDSAALFAAGLVTAAYGTCALVTGAGHAVTRLAWGRTALRAAGSWIAATGALTLALQAAA